MATSYPATDNGEILDQVLEATRPYVARLQRIGAQFGSRPASPGKTLQIPLVEVGEAAEFDRDTNNYCTAQGGVTLVDVKLTSHPKITFGITPEAYDNIGDAPTLAVDRASIDQAAIRVGTSALRAWHNLLPAAAATTGAQLSLASASAAAVTKADFAAILAAVFEGVAAAGGRPAFAGAEPANSALVLSAPYYAAALTLFDVAAWDRTANPVRDGWFSGGLLGFRDVLCDPMIPASVAGYVVPRGSFALAGRPVAVRNPSAYSEWGYRTDDRTGLTLTTRTALAPCVDDRNTTVEALFGGVLALPAQVLTILP